MKAVLYLVLLVAYIQVNTVQSQDEKTNHRLDVLERTVEMLLTEQKKLKEHVEEQDKRLKEQEEIIQDLKNKLLSDNGAKSEARVLEKPDDQPRGQPAAPNPASTFLHSGSYYAFYASGTYTQNLNFNGEVIRFPSVRYNAGSAYSSATSKFTCPDNGVYAFFVTIMSAGGTKNTYARWKIVRNYSSKAEGHTGYGSVENQSKPNWGSAVTGSQMSVIKCWSGYKVWVQTWRWSEDATMETFSRYCSFGGFKLA